VASGGDAGSGRVTKVTYNLRVIATFTQEKSKKFIGDIRINVFDGKAGPLRFPADDPAGYLNGNVIDTGLLRDLSGSEVYVNAYARVVVEVDSSAPTGVVYQDINRGFVIPKPTSGDTLEVTFNVDVAEATKPFKAANALAAEDMFRQSLKGYLVLTMDAQAIGKQQFRVTGKYYSGEIQSSIGQRFTP
jgi:hypothetical protein